MALQLVQLVLSVLLKEILNTNNDDNVFFFFFGWHVFLVPFLSRRSAFAAKVCSKVHSRKVTRLPLLVEKCIKHPITK